MADKMKNMVGSFVILYALIILITSAWSGFREGYDLSSVEDELQDGKTVFEKLGEINLLSGINDLTLGIQKLTKLSNPADLLGALALSASGSLQIIGGIVTFPIDIFKVITPYYGFIIPPVVTKIIGFMAVLAVGFILLKAKLGGVEI